MDQIYQLQQQIQKLRQDVNNIQHNCQQLNNDINNMSSAALQISNGMGQKMIQPQQFGSFSAPFAPMSNIQNQGWGTNNFQEPLHSAVAPFQTQRLSSGWAGHDYTPMQSGFQQNYGQTLGMNNPNDYSQSYAQNQRVSQQAQQALDNRVNRAAQGMFAPSPMTQNYSGNY